MQHCMGGRYGRHAKRTSVLVRAMQDVGLCSNAHFVCLVRIVKVQSAAALRVIK